MSTAATMANPPRTEGEKLMEVLEEVEELDEVADEVCDEEVELWLDVEALDDELVDEVEDAPVRVSDWTSG